MSRLNQVHFAVESLALNGQVAAPMLNERIIAKALVDTDSPEISAAQVPGTPSCRKTAYRCAQE